MQNKNSDRSVQIIVWFSRILRWFLGIFFIIIGIVYYKDGTWPAIFIGAVLMVTGFFRPKRCLDESCAASAYKLQ
jgi:hypothetical protein